MFSIGCGHTLSCYKTEGPILLEIAHRTVVIYVASVIIFYAYSGMQYHIQIMPYFNYYEKEKGYSVIMKKVKLVKLTK